MSTKAANGSGSRQARIGRDIIERCTDKESADPKSPRKQTIHRNPDRPHRKLHQKQNLHQVRTTRRSLPSHQNPPRYTRLQKDSSTTWMIRSTPTWAIAPPTPPRSLTLMGFQKSRRHEETWREPYWQMHKRGRLHESTNMTGGWCMRRDGNEKRYLQKRVLESFSIGWHLNFL